MIGAIKHGLRNIFTIDGRDARQTFWYYMLFVYLAGTIVSSLATFALLAPKIGAVIAAATTDATAGRHTDPMALQGVMMADMADQLTPLTIVIGILNMAFVGAALVRRLHDSNLSGLWALLPGIFYAINVAATPFILHSFLDAPAVAAQPGQIANGFSGPMLLSMLIGYVPLIALLLLGVRPSSPGPNRFGDSPVRF